VTEDGNGLFEQRLIDPVARISHWQKLLKLLGQGAMHVEIDAGDRKKHQRDKQDGCQRQLVAVGPAPTGLPLIAH
jgi:hypothetical protein